MRSCANSGRPALVLVWPLEEEPCAHVIAQMYEDEQRLRLDLQRRRHLAEEIASALGQLIGALDDRAEGQEAA